MKFCFLTTFYPPHNFGGDGIATQRLARALVRRGHQATVVYDVDAFAALRKGPIPHLDQACDGVEVIPLQTRYGTLSTLLTQQLGQPVLNGRRIRQILAERRFDVINFNNISLLGGPGLLSFGDAPVKLYFAHEHWLVCPSHTLWRHQREVCTGRQCIRCVLHYHRPPQAWRYGGYLTKQLRHVDAFIAMSEFSRRKHQEFGFQREMEVLPYFLPDMEPMHAAVPGERPHPKPYFLFVGRLERLKGLDDVIPLFREYPDADLVIVGDGGHTAVLKELGSGCPHVRFVGRVEGERLRDYYHHAIALVVPSVTFETFGIVLIEAFKCGTPVIARRIGPFPEIVEQSNAGELFETSEELLAAMRRLQQDPQRRDRLGRNGYDAYCRYWSESAVLPKYLEIVQRTAGLRERPQDAHSDAVALHC